MQFNMWCVCFSSISFNSSVDLPLRVPSFSALDTISFPIVSAAANFDLHPLYGFKSLIR